jgi:hypothetical protein
MQANDLELTNKLFCTFCKEDSLDNTLETVKTSYNILYNKIFILHSKSSDEYIFTYNVDPFNTSGQLLENTILAHRKKDSNTLYTINALNSLIKKLNNGVLNTKYPVNWLDYKNCVLLTQNNELKQLETKIYKIISLDEKLG